MPKNGFSLAEPSSHCPKFGETATRICFGAKQYFILIENLHLELQTNCPKFGETRISFKLTKRFSFSLHFFLSLPCLNHSALGKVVLIADVWKVISQRSNQNCKRFFYTIQKLLFQFVPENWGQNIQFRMGQLPHSEVTEIYTTKYEISKSGGNIFCEILMYKGGLQMHHIGSWCPGRHSICPLLFLQPLSEGCGTRLTIRNKDQKNL